MFQTLGLLSCCLNTQKDLLEDMNRDLNNEPSNLISLISHGNTYRMLGQYENSLENFNKALEIEPNNLSALRARGDLYKWLGRYKESLSDLNKSLEIEPNDMLASEVQMAQFYYNLFDDMERLLSKLNITSYKEAYEKEYKKFISGIEQIITNTNESDNTYTYIMRGFFLCMSFNLEQSLLEFNKILGIEPKNAFVLRNRGNIYRLLDRYNESLADLDKALEIEPNNALTFRDRGNTYRMLQQYKESLADLNKSLEINPNDLSSLGIHKISSTEHINECIRQHLKNNIHNWASGNEFLDDLIQSGFGSIFTSTWIDGRIVDWDEKAQKFVRSKPEKIVLKLLDKSNNASIDFFKEAITNIIFSISNPVNSVKCYGLTKYPDSSEYMLILKYMNDGDLNAFLFDENNKYNWKQIYSILQQILNGLCLIHGVDMVHKDIHPGNILSDQIKWYISDFGTCGPADKNPADQVFGIIPYVAPEVLYNKNYSTASDMYSIGIIMWQLVTRRKPFDNYNYDIHLARNICNGLRPLNESRIPYEYKCLMERCWDLDLLRRPSAFELIEYCFKMLGRNDNEETTISDLDFLPFVSQVYLSNNKSEITDYRGISNPKNKSNSVYLLNAHANLNLGNLKEGLSYLNKLLDIEPNNVEFIFHRGIIYLMLDRYEESLADLNKALENEPDDIRILRNRGIIYENLNRHEESLADLNRALEIKPDNAGILRLRGMLYERLNRYEESLADLNRALEIKPNDTEILRLRGLTYIRLDRYEKSLADLDRVLEIESNDIEALRLRVNVNIMLNRYEELITDLNKILGIELNNTEILELRKKTYIKLRWTIYEKLNRYEESLADLNRTLEIDPNNIEILKLRGLTYIRLDRYEKSLVDFDKVLKIDSNDTEVLKFRAKAYIMQDRYKESLVDLNKILEIEPNNTEILKIRAKNYIKLGRYEESLADLNKTLEIEPNDTEILKLLGGSPQRAGLPTGTQRLVLKGSN
ncbi:hypothetical protein C2G38_2158265 [Gigaspora rosea]|uniref:Protein kinase domain-containing protein n=1 Tax=Gigaspora rosea TaxID=44941 RepID=A0A397W0K8_9GLOM|nr:hypothetical protein C2G38_2158265 [Gigaspora rosea]